MWKVGIEGKKYREPKGVKKKGKENLNVTMRMRSSRMMLTTNQTYIPLRRLIRRDNDLYIPFG